MNREGTRRHPLQCRSRLDERRDDGRTASVHAVTDGDGNFEMTQIPAGDYEIVAWHEGWKVVGESALYDVMTQLRVKRPVFSAPVNWSKHVRVPAHDTVEVTFTLSERTTQVASAE